MKRIIILLSVLLLYGKYGDAQVRNYHFCEQPGGLTLENSFNGYPDNWQRSHGTPSWGTSWMYMWHSNYPHNPGTQARGEGIYQDHVFPAPGVYTIHIGINAADGNGRIRIFETPEGALTPTTTISSGEPIPTIPGAVFINDFVGFVSAPTMPVDFLASGSFVNTIPNGQIWIFPEQLAGNQGWQTDCTIDYVSVCPIFDPGVTFSSGTITNGYFLKNFVNIGSSFGGSGTVVNNASQTTEYNAETNITMAKNTLITATQGHHFLGRIAKCEEIKPWGCGAAPLPPPGGNGESGGGSGGKNSTGVDNYTNAQFHLYPNPNNGVFDIGAPMAGNYTVRVVNMLGANVYESTFDGQKKRIELDVNLPSGTYTVHVSGGSLMFTNKISLIR